MNYKNEVLLEAGFVNAGNLLSFASTVPSLQRCDILNSILLAQLAADKKYSRIDNAEKWYGFYTDTLGQLTWQSRIFKFNEYTPHNNTFTLEDVVFSVFEKNITDDQLSLVKKTINTFRDLPNDDMRVELYDKLTHSLHIINVQVGVVNSLSVMSTVGIILKTKQEVERLFTGKFSVSMLDSKIITVLYSAALNEELYSSIREKVIDKLGLKRNELILDLDIVLKVS